MGFDADKFLKFCVHKTMNEDDWMYYALLCEAKKNRTLSTEDG